MGKLDNAQFLVGDARKKLRELPKNHVQTAVTSPPYWGLRDYGESGQIGLEENVNGFIGNLCDTIDEVGRVLREDGTLWLNIGDSYFGGGRSQGKTRETDEGQIQKSNKGSYVKPPDWSEASDVLKPKDQCLIPHRVSIELQERGWYVRSDIIWNKPAPMPESVQDRPTTSYEHVFLLTKNKDYYYDYEAIKEKSEMKPQNRNTNGRKNDQGRPKHRKPEGATNPDSRNKRDVWTVNTANYGKAHFAVYPVELIEPCVKAGSREGDVVLDPFSGTSTTGVAALKHGRKYIGIDLNEKYHEIAKKRIRNHNEVPTNHDFW